MCDLFCMISLEAFYNIKAKEHIKYNLCNKYRSVGLFLEVIHRSLHKDSSKTGS